MADSNAKIEQRKKEAYNRRKKNVKKAGQKLRPSAKKRLIAIICAVVIVAVGGCAIFLHSGLARRVVSAANIGDEKISAAEYSYYYTTGFTNYYQTMVNYVGEAYVGIDTTQSLKDQDYDEDRSYADYFSDRALEDLQNVIALSEEAEKAGYTMSEEDQATFDEQIETIESAAETAGMSVEKYIQQLCGKGYTMDMYKNILRRELIAFSYAEEKEDSFTYTEDDFEAYYAEHKDDFAKIDFRYEPFKTQAATDTQEEVTLEQAKAAAETFMQSITDEESFSAASIAYEEETAGVATDNSLMTGYTKESTETIDSNLADWLFASGRKVGDLELIEGTDDSGYYVAMLVKGEYRDEYKTRSVRHILIMTDDDVTEEDSLAKIEEIYEEWQNGEATEDSFAELAEQYSDDTGSNTNGGLYTGIYPGQMVEPMDEWVFADHEYGDTDIISTEWGYNLVFYVGESDLPYWEEQIETAMRDDDYNAWYDEILQNYEIKTHWLGIRLREEPLPLS